MPLNTSFFISDQFLAYETMKNDSKLKNGEKWLFGSFILGSADFGPNFSWSHMLQIGQKNTNNTFRGMPGIQNSLQMSI